MENGEPLNLELISKDCDLFSQKDSGLVISKIAELEKTYSSEQFVQICNYMLSVCKNPGVLEYLIRCVDKYRHPSSLEFLTDILLLQKADGMDEKIKEQFTKIRILCTKAISNQKNTDVTAALLYCMNNKNENYRLRLACADALGKIGSRHAASQLIKILKDESEKSVYLKESAACALGKLGDAAAIDPLVDILETKHEIADKFSFLKERIIEALDKMGFSGNERAFKALKNSLSDNSPQVRIEAVEAIMNSAHPDSFNIIKEVMTKDEDEEVKKNALTALYNMKDRSILDEVINSSTYSDNLKMAAVKILDEYENEEDEK